MTTEIENALKSIKEHQCISGSDLLILTKHYGDRFWKALVAVANTWVKKYIFEPSGREAWVVVGKSRDYRVLSEIYCDCEDFYINVIVKRKIDRCYHILAQILAEALGTYSEIRLDDMRYDTLRNEWEMLMEKSPLKKPQEREPLSKVKK